MPRAKQWTTEDTERALQWVSNKAKTGAIFRGQSQTAEELVPRLAGISDPAELAAALAAELTPEAWKRLLNALRQRKHAAGGESEAGPQPAPREEEKPCASCQRLTAKVTALESALAAAKAKAVIPPDKLKLLRMLCHPDKHAGSKAATKASTYLNSLAG